MAVPYAKTKQGYEIQFGTNHIGHALFTKLLLPTILKTADLPNADVRIINISSYGHNFAPSGGIIFDQIGAEAQSTNARYGSSKLANILHARSLAQKYPQITATSVHPGIILTDLYTSVSEGAAARLFLQHIMSRFAQTVPEGARNQLWAATGPRESVRQAYFYTPIGKADAGSKYAQDEALQQKLWEYTEGELAKYGY
jgi:NAD(P)-dependent dehydrogenase (short-subunit alcohol dehydrogenase family)